MAKAPYYQPGLYWGKITRQHLGKSSGGYPQLILSFQVLGKINPADPDGDLLPCGQQFERTMYRVITENTIDYTMRDLDKLQWSGEQWSQFDEDNTSCVDIRGNELAFWCSHEAHYETGAPREVWSLAMESTGPKVEPLDSAEERKLNAMFGKQLKGRGKSVAQKLTARKMTQEEPQPESVAGGPEPPAESDIPF